MFDDFFKKVIDNRKVIEAIVESVFDDTDINYSPKKSIIFDVHVITDKEVINIEVAKHKEKLVVKRGRYNASVPDVDSSKKACMKPIKVLSLCEFDSFYKELGISCKGQYRRNRISI